MRFPECNNFVKNVKYIPIDKEILSGFIRSYSKEEIDYMLTIADEGAREKIKYILENNDAYNEFSKKSLDNFMSSFK